MMHVPSGVGLGRQLDAAKLARYQAEGIRDAYLDPAHPEWFPTKPQY
jgi:hypothetical protein